MSIMEQMMDDQIEGGLHLKKQEFERMDFERLELINALRYLLNDYRINEGKKSGIIKKMSEYIPKIQKGEKVV